MGLKVIGAGFGRTGTMSTMAAMEQLGFGKCHHMKTVFENPEQRHVFIEAAEGGTPDWDGLFKDYQAAVDFPTCVFYRELMGKYPDAKVVLNVRDPEKWYESVSETIYKMKSEQVWKKMVHMMPHIKELVDMTDKVIWDGTFHGRFEDKEYAIKVFLEHIEEVKKIVPKEKLLVFSVKEGWKPLCDFLGVKMPDTPFPHVNERASSFAEQCKKMTSNLDLNNSVDVKQ